MMSPRAIPFPALLLAGVEIRNPAAMHQASRADARLALPPSPMVGGVRRTVVAVLLWSRVVWLALRLYQLPSRAAMALLRLRATRRCIAPRRQKLAFASGRYFWDLYAPGWPSPAFDRYVEGELERLVPVRRRPCTLQGAIIAITRRCALRCEHCFEWNVLNRHEPLSSAALQEIVRRLLRQGVTQLFLSGGEPLQRFNDVLTLTAAASGATDVWVFSSGRGLTADRAARLKGAGLTGVALSLDHWDATAHDRFRGVPGTFAAVQRAAASARDAGLLVALSLCPTRAFVSFRNLHRYARTARSLGASFIQVLEPKPVGHYAGRDVTLDPRQQWELERFNERMNLDPAVRDMPAVTYPDRFARAYGCPGAGDRFLYIDTEGALHACPFCPATGVAVLDDDIDAAIAAVRADGCPAAGKHMAARSGARANSLPSRPAPPTEIRADVFPLGQEDRHESENAGDSGHDSSGDPDSGRVWDEATGAPSEDRSQSGPYEPLSFVAGMEFRPTAG
jgi:MoaA/NifB/PqqE/SkfB family radical SAM enzyme